MSPPFPVLPAPTDAIMAPPLPFVALPVTSEKIPLAPELVVPVKNDKCPLTPLVPAFAVFKSIDPLDDVVPWRVNNDIEPPDKSVL